MGIEEGPGNQRKNQDRDVESIPIFPNFKKVELGDRSSIESITGLYPAYSDFDFTSLWAWDVDDAREISRLNDNLVVKFTDYATGKPFLSFLGVNNPTNCALELLKFAEKHNMPRELSLVPEASVIGIDREKFNVTEDRDQFDYVFSVPHLARLEGSDYRNVRQSAAKFKREHPTAQVDFPAIIDSAVQNAIFSLSDDSLKKKGEPDGSSEREGIAIQRLLQSVHPQTLLLSVVREGSDIRAFSIDEHISDKMCMGHFWKADTSLPGIYEFMAQKIAEQLQKHGIEHWNWEQDLGIENLRRNKLKFKPDTLLKKYRITASA